jgi:uncharacterized membrane protein YfcA
MEIVILTGLGLAAGLFGGLLGIGGSLVIIPGLVLAFGENQHLYQASAMICNFFVAVSSIFAHRKADSLAGPVLRWMAPAAMAGILAGVALSDISFFAGKNSYMLARTFGAFLVYVVVYNCWKLYRPTPRHLMHQPSKKLSAIDRICSAFTGLATGLGAGMLGIGAGTISTPMQQLLLRMPLKNAMSNSAAVIVSIAWLGAIYKNWTLSFHGQSVVESLRIAALIVPTGILGGYIGGRLMHSLPKQLVRAIFILVAALGAIRLLTIGPR